MTGRNFLVEIGTEELPPKSLHTLSKAFGQAILQGLKEAGLAHGDVRLFATPRRLGVEVLGLALQQTDKEIERFGPNVKAAYDVEGNPTAAAFGFASSCDIDIADIKTKNTDKGERLFYSNTEKGEATHTLLPAIVRTALDSLPIAKRMRWGSNRVEFIRPVHWVIMLFGHDVIECDILGKEAGRTTYGHRFHFNEPIEIAAADEYAENLQSIGRVIVDFEQRSTMIADQVRQEAKNIGGTAVIDPDLLSEVTGLVELPVALTGKFEERFLSVPAEALISSMKEHQKYFHVLDAQGKIMPYFITVSNIESVEPHKVIEGNEKVIRPRLSDAAFFFETDKKKSLSDHIHSLKTVVFQAKLGTVYDKTQRVKAIAESIAHTLGADAALAGRAAELCKSDLMTEMVMEFTDLQGIMGYYYAKHDGEPEEVALALNEQYMPRFAGDTLATTQTGAILALADRIDTLVGIFGIGQKPTGTKDPFALRRASLGVLRIMVEKALPLDLKPLLTFAANQHTDLPAAKTVVEDVLAYMIERFSALYQDQGIPAECFLAVKAKALSEPFDIDNRVKAVYSFTKLEQADALSAANKRVRNILAKQANGQSFEVSEALFQEDAEKALFAALTTVQAKTQPLFEQAQYTQGLEALATIRQEVDAFFDTVMVMADDEKIRHNRLGLLQKLYALFDAVADISLLQKQ